jgi:hypothetical protein
LDLIFPLFAQRLNFFVAKDEFFRFAEKLDDGKKNMFAGENRFIRLPLVFG